MGVSRQLTDQCSVTTHPPPFVYVVVECPLMLIRQTKHLALKEVHDSLNQKK